MLLLLLVSLLLNLSPHSTCLDVDGEDDLVIFYDCVITFILLYLFSLVLETLGKFSQLYSSVQFSQFFCGWRKDRAEAAAHMAKRQCQGRMCPGPAEPSTVISLQPRSDLDLFLP
jgi:hypothetical protein